MPQSRLSYALVIAALAAASAAASGCEANATHFEKVFDPCAPLVLAPEGATEDELASIDGAIDLWGQVAVTQLTRDEVADARRMRIRFDDTELYMGYFDDVAGEIWLSRVLDDRQTRSVVLAHELGHAFNLYHVAPGDRVSVMNEGNGKVGPNEEDGAELVHKWGTCAAR